jgi:hypothetical protein
MHAKPVRFAIAVLFAAAARGQIQGQTTTSQSVSQVFHFTYAQAPIDIQQITNAVRTVGEITQAYPNADAKTLTVSGTPAQIAMASWMFATMDQPAPANQATQEYRPSGSFNDVVRVLYPTHPQTPQTFQEIVNAVRTIPQITKVFPYSAQNAVVMRGTDSQAAMGEWLFHQMDVPAGMQPVQNPAAHQYVSPDAANDEAQVLFLSHPWSPQSMQQIVNTVRVIPQLTKVFPCTATGAVSVRGPTATVALAVWLFSQLDRTPQASSLSPLEFQMPGGADDVTQVFYLTPATTAQSLQSIVTAVRGTVTQHVFPDDMFNAVTLRGTAAQIAAADSLIKQMNNP